MCFSSTLFSLQAGGTGQKAFKRITMCFSSTSFSLQAGGDEQSGLEGNGRRSRRRRRPVGAAVAARVSDERSEESARQDERQPASRSPRSAARFVITDLDESICLEAPPELILDVLRFSGSLPGITK